MDFKELSNQLTTKQQDQTEKVKADQITLSEAEQILEPKSNKQNISLVKSINQIKQSNQVSTMCFNYNSQMMFTAIGCNLKIWNILGKMRQLKKLSGHTSCILNIVSSQKVNWFASSDDGIQIRCWKQQQNWNWESFKSTWVYTLKVQQMILNKEEDELISNSKDGTINVWKINYLKNQIQYYYTLDTKSLDQHAWWVSLNQSETYLVLSSFKRIILYKKDKSNKWQYNNEIINQENGYGICFISDNRILLKYKQTILTYLEIQNDEFIKKPEYKLNNKMKKKYNLNRFPAIFNQEKQIIIIRSNEFIYFIKINNEGKLQLASDPMLCYIENTYVTISFDGNFLVFCNQNQSNIKMNKIQYHFD